MHIREYASAEVLETGESDVRERDVERDSGASGVRQSCGEQPGMLMHVLSQFCFQIAQPARPDCLGALKF